MEKYVECKAMAVFQSPLWRLNLFDLFDLRHQVCLFKEELCLEAMRFLHKILAIWPDIHFVEEMMVGSKGGKRQRGENWLWWSTQCGYAGRVNTGNNFSSVLQTVIIQQQFKGSWFTAELSLPLALADENNVFKMKPRFQNPGAKINMLISPDKNMAKILLGLFCISSEYFSFTPL